MFKETALKSGQRSGPIPSLRTRWIIQVLHFQNSYHKNTALNLQRLVNTLWSQQLFTDIWREAGQLCFLCVETFTKTSSHCWDLCQHGHRYQHLPVLLGIYNVLCNQKKTNSSFFQHHDPKSSSSTEYVKSAMCFSHQQWITIYIRLTWSCCHCFCVVVFFLPL